jgi:hypothetical protein
LLTGCRYSELAAVRAADFNPDAGMVTAHLRRILRTYARSYNNIRTHRSLDKDAVWSKYWSEASISSIENLIALITVPVPHRRPG